MSGLRLKRCVFNCLESAMLFVVSHETTNYNFFKKNQPLRQNHKNTKTEGDFGFPTLKALSFCFFTWVLLLIVLLFEQQTLQGNFLRSDRSPHGHTGTRGIHGHTGTRGIHRHTGTRGLHGHTRNPRAHEESTGTRAQESTKLSNMTESWQHCGGRTASPQKGIYGARSHSNAWRNDLRSRQTTTLRCTQTTRQGQRHAIKKTPRSTTTGNELIMQVWSHAAATGSHTDRQTDRQPNRQMHRQVDSKTDTQTYRYIGKMIHR